MPHTDPEILALRALGEKAGTSADDEHVAACTRCRAELTRLTEVVALARDSGGPEPLQAPPPQVWTRVAAAAGSAAAAGDTTASDGTAAAADGRARQAGPGMRHPRSRTRGGWRRRRLAAGLAGLAAGLIIGVGATAGITQLRSAPPARVIARIELRPLPQFPQWRDAAGTAVMQAARNQRVIAVTLKAPPRPGFYEVWLLARNGVSMISLGDLNAAHAGSFTVPAGVDLRNYSRIDVSLQPFNGSTLHSKTSVARGSLPPAAMTAGARAGPGA